MGLLDDAIREHLELKRRSGADPGEIAYKEQEALAPVFPEEEDVGLGDPPPTVAAEPPADEPATAVEAEPVKDDSGLEAEGADFTHVGQETAELDMRSVLDGHEETPATVAPVRAFPAPPDADQESSELAAGAHEAFDGAAAPQEIPGQERLTFE
ncbi:MAG: hypothetical protein H0X28_11645 [Solirubrobacterales bacterium]|nr:hypothetical protein [Solirubrobacterales bacterium]